MFKTYFLIFVLRKNNQIIFIQNKNMNFSKNELIKLSH